MKNILNYNDARVFIVDDKPENLSVLYNYLYTLGLKVYTYQTAKRAIEQAFKNPPDIILLDVMMPNVDGFEACKILKNDKRTSNIPIIFISALTDTVQKVKAFQSGAIDYITKPFAQEEVFARINTHLTIKKQQNKLAGLNKKLSDVNKELTVANDTKDRFFSIIAHDLKNQLRGTLNLSELLQKNQKNFSEDAKNQKINDIHSSVCELNTLLENLLQWASTQTNRVSFDPQKIYFKKAILPVLPNLASLAQKKNIELSIDVSPSLVIFADPNMVSTIVRNLVTNSIKYTSQNGKISISAKIAGSYVVACVNDNGIGMNEEICQTLFNVDRKFTKVGTEGERGTGLGLFITKEFVEKNNGRIWVESVLNKGSDFYFTLPLVN